MQTGIPGLGSTYREFVYACAWCRRHHPMRCDWRPAGRHAKHRPPRTSSCLCRPRRPAGSALGCGRRGPSASCASPVAGPGV